MKKVYVSVSIILIFSLLFIFFLCLPRKIKFYECYHLDTDRECKGLFWFIATKEENVKIFEQKYHIVLPANDYEQYYLLISDGREINKLHYNKISKYLWEYDVPMGIEEFSDNFYEHKMICYRIDKIFVKQDGE